MKKIIKIIKYIPCFIVMMIINFYRACISPMFPGCCRFKPTCSEYALESFKKYGFCKGFILTIKRLSKCHPFGGRGYDPVPENLEFNKHRFFNNKQIEK